MSYERFEDLVRVETSLRRDLHYCAPREAKCLSRAIATIHNQLRNCVDYGDFLRRMALSCEAMG